MLFHTKSKQEKGQGLVEYAIILALVAIVVVGSMTVLGPKISCTLESVNNSLPGEGKSSVDCAGGESVAKTEPPTAAPAMIEGDAARSQYCAERPGYTGGVNWGFAGGHTWTTDGQTYHVTGEPFNCPY